MHFLPDLKNASGKLLRIRLRLIHDEEGQSRGGLFTNAGKR
jgi:hypothetical protein